MNLNLGKNFLKYLSYMILALNLISIGFGVIYLAIPIYNIIWDIHGLILLTTLFGNLFLVFINGLKLNKNVSLGNKLNLLCYFYLVFNAVAILLMAIGNVLISGTFSNELLANTLWLLLVFFGYFGLLGFGAGLAGVNIYYNKSEKLWDPDSGGELHESKRTLLIKKVLKIALGGICVLFTIVFIYFALITLSGSVLGDLAGSVGMFVSQFDLFLGFTSLGCIIILLKMINFKKRRKIFYCVGIFGLILSGILLLPLILTPLSVYDSEVNFSSAFGSDWRSKISPTIEDSFFMPTPFSIPGYFLGIPPKNCIEMPHIKFYENATEGIELYFDAYLPPNQGIGLPGKNSTIIKIHGGAWVAGDKGMGNMMQVNKYLAAQGYVVFDIQYGLAEEMSLLSIITPEYVQGNFTFDDMLRHIGNFTQYLGQNNATFGANLDSTFIMGNSAGGHLTCATALGIHNGSYTSIFGSNLTIKGMIPIYPGIRPTSIIERGIGSSQPGFNYPELLVNDTSPPALVFQGTQDGLVHPITSQILKNTYTSNGNSKCAVLWMHLGGHAGDFYFSGYHNQVFMYYLERFLYLCVNGFI